MFLSQWLSARHYHTGLSLTREKISNWDDCVGEPLYYCKSEPWIHTNHIYSLFYVHETKMKPDGNRGRQQARKWHERAKEVLKIFGLRFLLLQPISDYKRHPISAPWGNRSFHPRSGIEHSVNSSILAFRLSMNFNYRFDLVKKEMYMSGSVTRGAASHQRYSKQKILSYLFVYVSQLSKFWMKISWEW